MDYPVSGGAPNIADAMVPHVVSGGLAVPVTQGGQAMPVTGTVTASTTPPSTGTQTSVASSASDVTLLAANASRKGATVYNDSTQVLYLLAASGTSSATNYSVQIAAGGYYELPALKDGVYTGILKGIWASANGNVRVTEFT